MGMLMFWMAILEGLGVERKPYGEGLRRRIRCLVSVLRLHLCSSSSFSDFFFLPTLLVLSTFGFGLIDGRCDLNCQRHGETNANDQCFAWREGGKKFRSRFVQISRSLFDYLSVIGIDESVDD